MIRNILLWLLMALLGACCSISQSIKPSSVRSTPVTHADAPNTQSTKPKSHGGRYRTLSAVPGAVPPGTKLPEIIPTAFPRLVTPPLTEHLPQIAAQVSVSGLQQAVPRSVAPPQQAGPKCAVPSIADPTFSATKMTFIASDMSKHITEECFTLLVTGVAVCIPDLALQQGCCSANCSSALHLVSVYLQFNR